MHISSYHKSLGDEVGWNIPDPTKVYASCIFHKNKHLTDGLQFLYPNAEIDIGGSGISLSKRLPAEIDRIMPDYSLYPEWESDLGMTTRGCIRNCHFCYVPRKEGKFRIHQHPSEFHDPSHKSAVLMDNNILADEDWFFEVTNYYIDKKMKVDFSQGLDLRLMTPDIAAQLKKLKRLKSWHFAFDSLDYQTEVESGIQMLYDAGVNLRSCANFYVYLHDDADFDSALKRCRILKAHNCLPYIMVNRDAIRTQRMTDLKRWTRPHIFFKCDFDSYDRSHAH